MAFQASARTRRKHRDAAAAVLGPDVQIREVGFGRAQARWTTTSIVIVSVFGSVFVVALLLGTILIPGGLLLIVANNSARPARTIVVADRGVAVLARSGLTGRTKSVVVLLPLQSLLTPFPTKPRRRVLGHDTVTFTAKELERLTAAVAQPTPVPAY